MPDSEANKQTVINFLQAWSEDPDKGAEFVTENFRWMAPRSITTIFPHLESRELRGRQALKLALALDEEIYENGHHGTSYVHFMIAADDWVVLQQDFETRTKDGRPYRNTYCFTFRLEGDKIAEFWEHADTLYNKLTCKPDSR